MTTPILALIGVPGIGVTSVARELSTEHGYLAADIGEQVESIAKQMGITELTPELAEPWDREVLESLVSEAPSELPCVIALPSRMRSDVNLLNAYRESGEIVVIYLRGELADVVARNHMNVPTVPALGTPRKNLKKLMDEADVVLKEIADVEVDTHGRTAAEVAGVITAMFSAR